VAISPRVFTKAGRLTYSNAALATINEVVLERLVLSFGSFRPIVDNLLLSEQRIKKRHVECETGLGESHAIAGDFVAGHCTGVA
jgi:hypothetical protein